MRNNRDVGYTPGLRLRLTSPSSPFVMPDANGDDNNRSVGLALASHATRPKLKEPTPYKANSVRAYRVFLRKLALVFALLGNTYTTDAARVLYRVIYLVGEASKR